MIDLLKRLDQKKSRLDSFRPLPKDLSENLSHWFRIELTYTSNAIEGNTLSRQETALVVEKGITVAGKTLTEHLEATNHATAWDFIQNHVSKSLYAINESLILDIHRIILQKIDDQNAGRYRTIAVRIAGSTVILPNAAKVPELMTNFIKWIKTTKDLHPVKRATLAHFKFVSIHPFVDGNGRVGRLLMNLLLMQTGYTPAVIRPKDRQAYIESIEKGQLTGELDDYYSVIYQAVERSLDIYLESVGNK